MQKIYREPRKIQKKSRESQENQSNSESSTHHVVDFDPLMMKQFFTNPGLLHIGENIFQNLDYQSLVTCQNVCQTWKIMLENPTFWLKTCIKNASKFHEAPPEVSDGLGTLILGFVSAMKKWVSAR